MRNTAAVRWRWIVGTTKYGLVVLYCVAFIFPIYYLVMVSLKSDADVFTRHPMSWSAPPTLSHYLEIFSTKGADIGRYVLNSTIVALSTTAASLLIGTLASYSIVRFKYPGRNIIAFGMLVVRMLPGIALVIPIYLLSRNFGLLDTYWVLILSYTVFNVPFVIWMMRGFIMEIPVELEECAMIDGCSRVGALAKVVLPLIAPGLAATAIFCLLLAWNEFLLAFILTNTPKSQTVPIILATQIEQFRTPWSRIAAMATLLMLPVLIFAVIVQKHLIRGLTFGAVKA